MMMMKDIKSTNNSLISINKMNTCCSMVFISTLVLKSQGIHSNTLSYPMVVLFHWQKMMPMLLTLSLTDKISINKKQKNTFNLNGSMIRSTLENYSTLKTTGSEKYFFSYFRLYLLMFHHLLMKMMNNDTFQKEKSNFVVLKQPLNNQTNTQRFQQKHLILSKKRSKKCQQKNNKKNNSPAFQEA